MVNKQKKIPSISNKIINTSFILRHSLVSEANQSRSLSELEVFRQKHNLPEDGEFYTAIGPDGKPRAYPKLK